MIICLGMLCWVASSNLSSLSNMIKACLDAGLREPELVQEEEFRIAIWRKDKATDQATDQASDQASDQAKRLILVLDKEMSRQDLMQALDLKHNPTFRENYLHPVLNGEWIEMTIAERPNDPNQKYRLTPKGKALQQQLKKMIQ